MTDRKKEGLVELSSITLNAPKFGSVKVIRAATEVRITNVGLVNIPRVLTVGRVQSPGILSVSSSNPVVKSFEVERGPAASNPILTNIKLLSIPGILKATPHLFPAISTASVTRSVTNVAEVILRNLSVEYPAIKEAFLVSTPIISSMKFTLTGLNLRTFTSSAGILAPKPRLDIIKGLQDTLGTVTSVSKIVRKGNITIKAGAVSQPAKTPNKLIDDLLYISHKQPEKRATKGTTSTAKVGTFDIVKTTTSSRSSVLGLSSTVVLLRSVQIKRSSTLGINSDLILGRLLSSKGVAISLPEKRPIKNITTKSFVSTSRTTQPTKGLFNTTGVSSDVQKGVIPGVAPNFTLITSELEKKLKKSVDDFIFYRSTVTKKPIKTIVNTAFLDSNTIKGLFKADNVFGSSSIEKRPNKIINDSLYISHERPVKDVIKGAKNDTTFLASNTIKGLFKADNVFGRTSIEKRPNKGINDLLYISHKRPVKDVTKGTKDDKTILTAKAVIGIVHSSNIGVLNSASKRPNKGIKDTLVLLNSISKDVKKPLDSKTKFISNTIRGILADSQTATKSSAAKTPTKIVSSNLGINASDVRFSVGVSFFPKVFGKSDTILGLVRISPVLSSTSLELRPKKRVNDSLSITINRNVKSLKDINNKAIISTKQVLAARALLPKDTLVISSLPEKILKKDFGKDFLVGRNYSFVTVSRDIQPNKQIEDSVGSFSEELVARAIIDTTTAGLISATFIRQTKAVEDSTGTVSLQEKRPIKAVNSSTGTASKILAALAVLNETKAAISTDTINFVKKDLISKPAASSLLAKQVEKPEEKSNIFINDSINRGNLRNSALALINSVVTGKTKGLNSTPGISTESVKFNTIKTREETVGLVNSGLLFNQDYALDYFSDAYVGEQRDLR